METDHPSPDWDEILLCLYTFTHKLLKAKSFFRKTTDGSFLKGKQVDDYVMDGVERYLSEPDKHDASLGSLTDYIKYNIIRGMISNDVHCAENKTGLDLFANDLGNDESYENYVEAMLPVTVALIDEQMDYNTIMKYIEEKSAKDEAIQEILAGLELGMKRREIVEETGMTTQAYDNGMKRLNTLIKSAIIHFGL